MSPAGPERPERLTIRQVAEDAGVSVATVSRVLAGSRSVSPELAVRVVDSARRLGYTPHAAAQSLASGRTRVVGVLVPNLANPYFYVLIKRMLRDAERDDYRLIVADSDENVGAERGLWQSLLRRTDGMILCSPRSGVGVISHLTDEAKPVVVLNRRIEDVALSNVVVDSYSAMRQLARHVRDLGHEKIVYVRGPHRSWEGQERWRAVRAALGGEGASGVTVTAIRAGGAMEDGHAAVPEVLRSGCTAVLAYNDLVAIGVIAGLTEAGRRVPDDISVAGFDDIPFARFVAPPLTTARSPQDEVGSAAWQTMVGLLGGDRPGARVLLPAHPIIRASTGPVP